MSGSPGARVVRKPVPRLLLLIYNIVYLVGFLGFMPIFLWKMVWDRSYLKGIRERMGRPSPSPAGDVIWVHGVSVGEVKAAAPIVQELVRRLPGCEVVISATTPTGRQVATRLYAGHRVVYYPLDFWRFPGRALDRIRPRCVLLMELELWPNFLHAAERRGVPVVVVNGRISERSYRGYRRVSWLLPQLDRIDLFLVQTTVYADRLRDLGVSPLKVHVTGNVKYDCLAIRDTEVDPSPELRSLLASAPEESVIVAGSTHPGEAERLARVLCALEKEAGRDVRLVIAPRHPEKTPGVMEELRRGLREGDRADAHPLMRLTEQRAGRTRPEGRPWLVVDTIGELEKAYSIADVVFVGGSLVHHGGQNMLEPVALGKPTVVGPHVWNFQAEVDLLVAGGGILKVGDERELCARLAFLLSHPEAARTLVHRAQTVLRANQGATARTMASVLELLRERVPGLAESVVPAGQGTRLPAV